MRLALAVLVVAMVAGCRTTSVGPYAPPSAVERDTTAAEKLNREAADLILSDPTKAEGLLREALTKDLFYGPAHNNLGVVFLQQEKLYEAANEFEWAKKLLPGQPDPHVNLALVMERAGRNDDAFRSYEAALAVAPEYVPAMQGAALLALQERRNEPRVDAWLSKVATGGETAAWRAWARIHSLSSGPQ